MYSRKYWLRKTYLDKCLKSRISEDPSTNNLENGSKHCCNRSDSSFIMLIKIAVKVIPLEKVTFNYIQNRNTVC